MSGIFLPVIPSVAQICEANLREVEESPALHRTVELSEILRLRSSSLRSKELRSGWQRMYINPKIYPSSLEQRFPALSFRCEFWCYPKPGGERWCPRLGRWYREFRLR